MPLKFPLFDIMAPQKQVTSGVLTQNPSLQWHQLLRAVCTCWRMLNISSSTSTTGSSIISLLCTTVVCVCVCVSDAFANDVPLLRWEVRLWRDIHSLTHFSSTCLRYTPKLYRSCRFVCNLGFVALWQNVFFIKSKAKDMTMLAELAHH